MSSGMWNHNGFLFGLLGAAVTFTLVGCGQSGPKLGKVSGNVRLNGEPLSGVMVEFQPVEPGSPSIGYTDDAGNYTLQFSRKKWGAVVGSHKIRINYDVDGREGKGAVKIPAEYHAKSTLQRDVEAGSNQHDFELASRESSRLAQRR